MVGRFALIFFSQIFNEKCVFQCAYIEWTNKCMEDE